MVSSSVTFTTGNIGYGKNASQSGTRNSWSADLALDGRGYGSGSNGLDYCAHANTRRLSSHPPAVAYWTVDLGKMHQILNVTIYNRRSK